MHKFSLCKNTLQRIDQEKENCEEKTKELQKQTKHCDDYCYRRFGT